MTSDDSRDQQIEASIQRLIRRELEKVVREAGAALNHASAKGMMGSSGHILKIETICRNGFAELATASAVQLAEIDGENAPQHADLLARILTGVQPEILEIFQKRAAPGDSMGPSALGIVSDRRQVLSNEMREAGDGIVSDLRLGIAGGINVKKRKAEVSIDNRGGAGQFILDSPGASQSVRGGQLATSGIDSDGIAALLQLVRQEVAKAAVSTADRNDIEDAVVSAEREVNATAPDPGRVRRLLGAVASRLEQFGINVGAGIVVAYLQREGVL